MPSGPDRAAGVDEMVITYAIGEQFRELIVPWDITTPGPPTHSPDFVTWCVSKYGIEPWYIVILGN